MKLTAVVLVILIAISASKFIEAQGAARVDSSGDSDFANKARPRKPTLRSIIPMLAVASKLEPDNEDLRRVIVA